MPKLGSNFDDKIYHFGAYALLAFLWAFLIERFNTKKPLLIAAMGTIAYGIVIEVLQHKINPLRTFDTLDILANCLGVMFGIIIVNYLLNHKVKIN